MTEFPRRLYGWRFSAVDAVALGVFGGVAYALFAAGFPLWWIVPVVVLHFLLFCNVFRVRRSLEIAWALIFMLNVTAWFIAGHEDWPPSLLSQLPVTIAFIVWEIRSPAYHGIFAGRLNPRLNQYLQTRIARTLTTVS